MTLASLANGAYRQSTAIDLASLGAGSTRVGNLKLVVKLKIGTGASTTGYSQLWVVEFDGTTWGNGATGTDGSYTPDDVLDLPSPLWTFPTRTASTAYVSPMLDVPGTLGYPILGTKVAFIIGNFSGATFDATGTNFTVEYTPYQLQNV